MTPQEKYYIVFRLQGSTGKKAKVTVGCNSQGHRERGSSMRKPHKVSCCRKEVWGQKHCRWHDTLALAFSQQHPQQRGHAWLCYRQRQTVAGLALPNSAAAGTACPARVASCQNEFPWSAYLQSHCGLCSCVVCWLLHAARYLC